MTRTVAEKMGVRAGARAHLVGAPPEAVAAMRLPGLELVDRLEGGFDHLHLFVTRQEELTAAVGPLREHLRPRGALWVSWPRGGRLGTDLTLPVVIRLAYDAGLVESTCLRVDDTWSALRLTHPRPGKTYHNSYGTLPGG